MSIADSVAKEGRTPFDSRGPAVLQVCPGQSQLIDRGPRVVSSPDEGEMCRLGLVAAGEQLRALDWCLLRIHCVQTPDWSLKAEMWFLCGPEQVSPSVAKEDQ